MMKLLMMIAIVILMMLFIVILIFRYQIVMWKYNMEDKIILLILKVFVKNSFYNRDNYKKTTSEHKL